MTLFFPLLRTALAVVVVACCAAIPLAAQDDPIASEPLPALSLQRLTIGAATTFFYAPWKDLNDSFGAVREAYAYNSELGLIAGAVDRHRGDFSPGIEANYRVFGPISVTIEGSMTMTGAQMDLDASEPGYIYNAFPSRTEYHNSFELRLVGVGAGLLLELPGSLGTRLRLTAGRSDATLDYAFRFASVTETGRFDATLRDHSTYISIGLESSIPISGSLSFSFGAHYRSLRFASLHGDGSMFHDYPQSSGSAITLPFAARLVKSGSYFGIKPTGDWLVEDRAQRLVMPWIATPGTRYYGALQDDTVPATLYMNGFGVRGGLTYAF